MASGTMTPGGPSRGPMPKYLSVLNPLTWWKRLDLDSRSFLMMLKGALPPTIVIAIYQSDVISDITTTIGYLSALISVLSQALMPRAKFMKIMFFDLISTCVSASLCCLAIFCAVEARKHNTPPDASESVKNGYSSDACAVAAVWLIFMIWAANTLRAWKPMELQDPMVAFSVFASVTVTRAGTFVTLSDGLEFVSRLLKGFMIGFAIATGVSLFIYPITSRGHVFHDIKGYIANIDAVLKAEIEYVRGSPEAWTSGRGLLSRTRTALSMRETAKDPQSGLQPKQERLSAAMSGLNALHSKLQSDLFYSKDEIAWGKLSAQDLNTIGGLLRSLLLPLSGMAMLPEILDMIVKNESAREKDTEEDVDVSEDSTRKDLEINKVVETLRDRLINTTKLVTAGLQYSLLSIELVTPKQLTKQRKQAGDEEIGEEGLNPLRPDFTTRFEEQMRQHFSRRKHLPRDLASLEAFSTSEKTNDAAPEDGQRTVTHDPDVRQEFFIILYMGQLQDNMLNATLEFIKFADGKIADGTMKRNRFIFPLRHSILEWLSLTSDKEPSNDTERRDPSRSNPSYVFEESPKHPDPEHLPPANIWERGSAIFRYISRFIKSEQSGFGFRVAAASFSVGILAYLHQTQEFFIRQRCIWAMIVIVIGMSPTSGQTMLGFVTRIVATVVSLALSLIVWYIVDQKTAGVIVFLYLANVFEYYFYVKVPQYFGPSVIAIVTLNVIVGYELQIRKLGLEVGTSNGQPYYPIYLFGPYKLAAVAAGCAISFFWVVFPYPITAKSTVRKTLGRGLFILAKFYSAMHATIELWLNGELGNVQDARSASHKLESIRHKVFKEEMLLLNSLRMYGHFSKFEPPIGGKFPIAVYNSIFSEIHRMLVSMALMANTTQNLDALLPGSEESDNPEDTWASRLASIALQSADFKSHSITSLLCHVSSAITNAQPLPPYLSAGHSFPLARQLQQIDNDLLSIHHVEDPAFSAFVTLEVLRTVVSFTLKDLLSNVKSLVGELSFDFHVQHTQEYEESARLLSARSEEE